jgi:acyl-homoserine-lactone acylase
LKNILVILIIHASVSLYAEDKATIFWTSHGVPHVKAKSWYEGGRGVGHAFASQNACTLIDQVIRIRGERSRYFGAGEKDVHKKMDIAYKVMDFKGRAKTHYHLLSSRVKQLIEGYTDGFNQYLKKVGIENLPGNCKGKSWAQGFDKYDLVAIHLSISMLAGTDMIWELIFDGTRSVNSKEALIENEKKKKESEFYEKNPLKDLGLDYLFDLGAGSNGWAFGSDYSQNKKGLIMANPHMPYYGSLKFHELQLHIEGEYKVTGAALYGVPMPLIGFNDKVAWTHTFAVNSRTFHLYSLDLKFGDSKTYKYGEKEIEMKEKIVSIDVLNSAGKIEKFSRKAYFTHYGPVVENLGLWWTPFRVYTVKDSNAYNFDFLEQWLQMGQAQSMKEFKEAHELMSSPWAYTIATSYEGESFFMNSLKIPKVKADVWENFFKKTKSNLIYSMMWKNYRLAIFDGSDPNSEWQGFHSFEEAPQLMTNSYTSNHNDSHWLTNAEHLLEGYSPFFGEEQYAQDFRTRQGHQLIAKAKRERGSLDKEMLKKIFFESDVGLMNFVEDDFYYSCQKYLNTPYGFWRATREEMIEACQVIIRWDKKMTLESRGAVLFREWAALSRQEKDFFELPFDAADPVHTPRGLQMNTGVLGVDKSLSLLSQAIKNLRVNGFALDVSLGETQYFEKGGELTPIAGGHGSQGLINLIDTKMPRMGYRTMDAPADPPSVNEYTRITPQGYRTVFGTSFIYFLDYDESNIPRAEGLLLYSQSSDPKSPYFNDQIKMWKEGELRPLLHQEKDILKDKNLVIEKLE